MAGDDPRPQRVVDVVVDVRDPVRDAYDLTFSGTWIFLSCMVTYPISDLERKVQSVALVLEMVYDAQGVFVVAEGASVGREGAGEGFFSCVTEGGVAEIVAERDRLREVFVEAESAGYGTGYLHHLKGVREACPEVVAVGGDEDLGLVHEPAEGLGVDNSVPVALEVVANTVGRLGPEAAYAVLNGPCGRVMAEADTGLPGFHALRPAPARRGPTSVFPGAWARTWERTTLRTLPFGPVCAGA